MERQTKESPVYPQPGDGTDRTWFDKQKVLYRSDTGAALQVAPQRFQVVQPRDVMEFYRDLPKAYGFTLETAGVLKGGHKVWGLAVCGPWAQCQEHGLPARIRPGSVPPPT
jgi:hypothetical protein